MAEVREETVNDVEVTLLRNVDKFQSSRILQPEEHQSSKCSGYEIGNIIQLVNALNDCIWCTNVFVRESCLQGNTKTLGICCKSRKSFYSSEDVYKELNYIDLILNGLLQIVSSTTGENGGDILIKSTRSNASDDDEAVDPSETSHGHVTETKQSNHEPQKESTNDREALKTVSCARSCEIDSIRAQPFSKKGEFARSQSGAGKYSAQPSIAVDSLDEIKWSEHVHEKRAEINEKISLANRFLGILSEDGVLEDCARSMEESLVRRRSEMPTDLELIKGTKGMCPWGNSWNPFKVTNIESLLFEKEKWRVEVVQKNGGDPLEHLCGIALSLPYDSFKNDTRATYYGIKRKNLLSISLQTADMSEKILKSMPQKIFSFSMLLLSITVYFSDLVSDLILTGDYYTSGSIEYAALTLMLVFAPLIAETLSKLILKALGWDKEYGRLKWKDVFNMNDFKIFKWMASSLKYSIDSMKDYREFAPCYAELHSHRCSKGKMECQIVDVLAVKRKDVDSRYIHTVFRSMLAWNDRFMLQTLLAESLNESGPQLLLQLIIAIRQYIAGESVGLTTWVCIVTSILNLSWSLHLSHFNRHYHDGGRVLNNSYEWKGRAIEFCGNCFVYGSRLASICLVTSVLGYWAIVGALVYLSAIYFVMITCSGRKEIYKTLHRYKTTIFWPLHRLFTVPYRIGIWRMDSMDHFLFYLEIMCLALSLPFLLPTDVNHYTAWIATGSVLVFEMFGIALLYAFKRFLHPYGYVCENR